MKKLLYSLFLCIVFLIFSGSISAYTPYVKNYTPANYKAASQNWSVQQSSGNKIYIGNHYGLLEFDGYNWRHYIAESKTPVRSIYIDARNRIYVGLSHGFGYFERNKVGELEYTSLSASFSDEELLNKEIWSISPVGDDIYFQTFGGYFIVKSDGSSVHKSTIQQLYLIQNVGNQIYIPDDNTLFTFRADSLVQMESLAHGFKIKAMTPNPKTGGAIVVTEANGIWSYADKKFTKWDNEIEKDLQWAAPNRAILTKDSLVLVGTIQNGVYALKQDGSLAWHINNKSGLQNNTILGMTCDKENNIWLALDNGVSVINNTRFLEVQNWTNRDVGAIYDVAIHNEKLFLATNQGLFFLDRDKVRDGDEDVKVNFMPNTEGYITDLHKTSDNKLFVGHNNRTLLLSENNALQELSTKGGAMCHKTVAIGDEEFVFQSTYTSLNVYRKEGNTWAVRNQIENFNNSIQFFEVGDHHTIWAAHSIQGLYRLKADKDYTKILESKHYPYLDSLRSSKTGVFKIRNRIVFTDENKCYTYDDLSDQIIPYDLLNDNIGHFKKAFRIVDLDRDNYWFITQNDAALINFENNIPTIKSTIHYQDYNFATLDGFQNIVPVNADYSIICYQNGIAKLLHDVHNGNVVEDAKLKLEWATAYSRKEDQDNIKLPISLDDEYVSIPYSHNNFHFGVSLPIYEIKHRFRFTLKELNEEQILTNEASIEYTRLPYGKYTLQVEAVNSKDEVVDYFVYRFEIKPPFYASVWAYLLYLALVLGIVYLIYYISKRKEINKSNKIRLKQEKEIIKLENEKLHSENTFKSKELASYAMSMIRQNEILNSLKIEITKQKDKLGAQYPNKYYEKLISIIDVNISSDQEWEIFQTNFDRIHESFFRNLRKRYPELTSSDLKLCALLRLNLDNKEIANLMNITLRGIETRRYRMRQKLNLETSENLTEFLIDFK